MKKNRVMRLASVLLVAVLMTTCTISGTFAKYVTETTSQDTARVANWGFTEDAVVELDLFDENYGDVQYIAANGDPANLIAPGTKKENCNFKIINAETTAPEVKYSFVVSVDGSVCDPTIQANKNIQWKLDDGAWGTWADLTAAILNMSGDASGTKVYEPGQIPGAFANGVTHTISWQWLFEGTETYDHDANDSTPQLTQDEYDTWMGNAADLADVLLKITVVATQVND